MGEDPPWAYEKAVLHPHDPGWAATAAAERGRLVEVLAPFLVDGVEHVGSTAVPGLAAKRARVMRPAVSGSAR